VQWDPLHEPDHFIDVRKLLASPSRRRTAPHRHQLRSSTLPPSVRRRRSSPQPQEGADALAPPPNDLTPKDRPCSAPRPLTGHWGAMKAQ